jgi:predicted protein tyrosine phosphatase
MKNNKKNLLFVCSRNQWRSPTAERMFARSEEFAVRSRGVSASAVRRLTRSDVAWADVIFVMEADHKRQLLKLFRSEVEHRPVHVLDIPDEYPFMDPELVDLIEAGVRAALGAVNEHVALRADLARHDDDEVTRQLNEVYGREPLEPDPVLTKLASRALPRKSWK